MSKSNTQMSPEQHRAETIKIVRTLDEYFVFGRENNMAVVASSFRDPIDLSRVIASVLKANPEYIPGFAKAIKAVVNEQTSRN